MNDRIEFNREFFRKHAQAWADYRDTLSDQAAAFRGLPHVPQLPARVSEPLHKMTPALNTALDDLAHNMGLGVSAADAFHGLLTETGRAYGSTEDATTDAANRMR